MSELMRSKTAAIAAALLAIALLAAAAPAAAAGECEYPYESVDATGETVEVDEEPERIVTLAPSTTQTLIELGDDNRIVGTESNSVFQYPEVADVPAVTYNQSGDSMFDDGTTEEILDLDPDVVIGSLIHNDPIVGELRDAGVTVYASGTIGSLPGIYDKVEEKGRLTGSCTEADEVVDWMEHEASIVEDTVAGVEPVDVYYHGGFWPGYSTTTEASFVGDTIERAGAWMILRFEDYDNPWPFLDDEELIAEFSSTDPMWIVRPDSPLEEYDIPEEDYWNSTTAVQEDQVLDVHQNYIQQSAPRVVIPLAEMAEAFHPDRYEAAEERAEEDDSGGSAGGWSGVDDAEEATVEFDEQDARIEPGDDFSIAELPGPVKEIAFEGRVEGSVNVQQSDVDGAPGRASYGFTVTAPEDGLRGTVAVEPDADVPVDDQWIAKHGDGGWSLLDTEVVSVDVDLLQAETEFSRFAVLASTEPDARITAVDGEDGEITLSSTDSSDEYGEIVEARWTVDGETSTGDTVTVSVEDEGSVEVELEVENDAGLTGYAEAEYAAEDVEDGVEEPRDFDIDEAGEGEDDADEADDGGLPLPGFGFVAAAAALLSYAGVRRHS